MSGSLLHKITTLGGAMQRAAEDDDGKPYIFEDGSPDRSNVMPIPVTADERIKAVNLMIKDRVQVEGDIALLEMEKEALDREILRHQIALAQQMQDEAHIPVPLAAKYPNGLPPEVPNTEDDNE